MDASGIALIVLLAVLIVGAVTSSKKKDKDEK